MPFEKIACDKHNNMKEVALFMDFLSEFSDSLNELMIERSLTIEALRKAIGISGATVGKWKTGEQSIYLTNALKLADYFDCSLEFLFNRTETRLDYSPRKCPSFFERLKEIMKLNNKTEYKMTIKDRVISRGQYHQWRTDSDPLIETLIKLAKYFNCTLDYLVGRDN
ncbi:MAG: helix-turn-helix domain-containing protein [Firmicutes bacterium]|nr:helix-turn-helix domain-containing protein [Bacillota bacterium]